ncbi:MAG: TetR/AcrR family transcriptional regulator [Myxococcota bacterium]
MRGRAPRAEPARERRSQAARTAETRGRIIAAVVESIADVGYQRTTASEIARRAGVTWGAVQHHFGGKDGILVAVLEDSFERFADRLADIDAEDMALEKRVTLFVDRAWEHFASAHYRSTFEILLNHAGWEGAASEPDWQEAMFRSWGGVWARLFGDVQLPRRRAAALQRYTIAALAGIASLKMLGAEGAPIGRPELELLKQTLVREMQRGES